MIEIGTFGALRVRADGCPVSLGGPKQRRLLALLLVRTGTIVSSTEIIAALWPEKPPAKAIVSVRAYVSNLRQRLGARLAIEPFGYRFVPAQGDVVDLADFEAAVAAGHRRLRAGDPATALDEVTRALRMWRDEPLAEFADQPFAQVAIERLHALRASAVDDRFDALLRTQPVPDADTIADLEAEAARYPMRETLWARLMTALHRSGRTGDALRVYERVRDLLDAELGTQPGAELKAALRSIAERTAGSGASEATGYVADPRRTPTLVGRDTELRLLTDRVRTARRGHGGLDILIGESGIGKSALASAAADVARSEGIGVVWAAHPADLRVPALWMWIQVIRRLGDRLGAEARGRAAESAPAAVAAMVPEWLPAEARTPPASGLDLLTGLGEVVRMFAASGPVLIVLDDLHLSDTESLDALRLLLPLLHTTPLAIVATWTVAGPEHRVDGGPLARMLRGDVGAIRLHGLTVEATEQLIDHLAPGPRDRGVARLLRQHTGGNPLYVRELVRGLGSDPARLTAAALAEVPDAISGVVADRLARLPDDVIATLTAAAVLGPVFDVSVLGEVLDLPTPDTLARMRSARGVGLIDAAPERPGAYRFGHGIVREAVMALAADDTRMRLHALVAQRHPATSAPMPYEQLLTIAGHAWAAGTELRAEIALELHETAIDRALHRSAHTDVLVLTEHALQIVDRMPRKPEVIDRQILLLLHHAGAAAILEGFNSAAADRAIARALDIGAGGDQRRSLDTMILQCHLMCAGGRVEEARAIVARLAADPVSGTTPALLYAQVMVHGLVGDRPAAKRFAELLFAHPLAPEPVTDPLAFFHPRTHCFLAIALAVDGDHDGARRHCTVAADLALGRGDTFNALIAQLTAVEVDALAGWRRDTAADADRAAAALTAAGAPQWAACARIVAAWARTVAPSPGGEILDDPPGAADPSRAAESAYADYVADGTVVMTPYFLLLRADIAAHTGRPDRAAHLLAQARGHAGASGERAWDGLIAERERSPGHLVPARVAPAVRTSP